MGLDTIRVFNKGTDLLLIEDDLEARLKPGVWSEVPAALVYRYLTGPQLQNIIVDAGPQTIRHPDMQSWPSLLYAGPIDGHLGYGSLSRYLIRGLKERCDLHYFNLGHKSDFDVPLDIWDIVERPRKECEWALVGAIPPELPRVPALRRILFSMWEISTIPQGHLGDALSDWAGLVNRWATALIVPCEVQRQSWIEGGVTIPVYAIPLGVDFDLFKYYERPARPDKPFTIVLYGWLTSRKSPVETVTEVCWQALGDREDCL